MAPLKNKEKLWALLSNRDQQTCFKSLSSRFKALCGARGSRGHRQLKRHDDVECVRALTHSAHFCVPEPESWSRNTLAVKGFETGLNSRTLNNIRSALGVCVCVSVC